LFALHGRERVFITRLFFDRIKAGIRAERFLIFLSDVGFEEIDACHEPKKQMMLDSLKEIDYSLIQVLSEIRKIADEIIRSGVLKKRQYNDCRHIASAIYSDCDYLVSWNIKHLSNVKTEKGVRTITNLLGYKDLKIITPTQFLEMEE
jgi:predicted nucleic acid-binding protein